VTHLSSMLAQTALRDFFFGDGAAHGPANTWVDALYMFIWWLSVFFFVLLMGLMVWFCFKYRRRPDRGTPISASHNTPLELFWSVVPTLLLVVIFFWGFWGYVEAHVAPGESEQASLTAGQWWWKVDYDNGAVSSEQTTVGARSDTPIFYFPEARPIQLRMTSTDVLHSFWIPAMRKKVDIFPNRYTSYWFRFEELDLDDPEVEPLDDGTPHKDYYVFCAEYCGDQHSEMAAIIRIVPDEYYRQWKKDSAGANLTPVEKGERIYKIQCSSCHSVDGSEKTGPSWKNFYGYEHSYEEGRTIVADDNHIRESILNPGAEIRLKDNGVSYGNQMNSFQGVLSPEDINHVIDYMKTLSDKGGAPAEGEAGATDAEAGGEAESNG